MEAIDVAEQRERGRKHGFGDVHTTANFTHDIAFCGRGECASNRKTGPSSYGKGAVIVLTHFPVDSTGLSWLRDGHS
jgi:hypothetical protein